MSGDLQVGKAEGVPNPPIAHVSQDPSDIWGRGYRDGKQVLSEALEALDRDGHQWSTRPCRTCALVSSVLGRRFGCARVAHEAGR